MNLVEILELNARKFGQRDCLRYNGEGLTYGQLDQKASQAAGLLQSWGVNKGDRVGLMSFNTPAFVIAYYGILRAGGVVVPINHKLQAPEVDYILNHSQAKLILADGALAPVLAKLGSQVRRAALDSDIDGLDRFEALLDGAPQAQPVEIADQDLAQILYTSGTTGKPKGCLHTHQTVLFAGITGALVVKMDFRDRLLMAMPIWHSSPLNNWFMGVQFAGGCTVLIREYHPLHFLQAVQDEKCTIYFGAPISYILPLQMIPHFDQFDLSSMRCWIYGGGPISGEVVLDLMKRYQSENFYQVYGMTEAGPTGTTLFPWEQVEKAGSIGAQGLPGADTKVMRFDGTPAQAGETGEIWLKAPSMMKGYYQDPAATAEAFEDGWYKTGDVARVDEQGYMFIVDRSKDMIVTGGENVYSKEVEDAIAAHPAVMEVAVLGRPHHEWGETVVAYVVPKPGEQATAEELEAFLANKLARYKTPRDFMFVAELPHTPTGKIMKYRLRQDGS
ncbi:MAG: AMP-binding protein [Desulfarculus sp.]|nr:AMP-binding protein [Pseudomonadota bacterium]MBV1717844.1 AMP-binding protein [Desulfarculus sp.]MBU4576590.1 AMP-binding protein [Pseudomonadota bacterium]MBU4596842.1 AMP-binding protein [Pseudomonadota bacterium]MBV1738916.1 AMP-binding protein [Desulfarculus sp.]